MLEREDELFLSRQESLAHRAEMGRWSILLLHECEQQYFLVPPDDQSDTQLSLLRVYDGLSDVLQSQKR